MRFIWSSALWLLLAVPLLCWAYEGIVRQSAPRPTIHYAALELASRSAGRGQGLRRRFPPLLFLLGIVALLFAVARPAAVFLLPAHRGTVVLAMDVSLSMAATDVLPSRLAAAQVAAAQFVQKLPAGIRVGVLTFADRVDVIVAPTTDKARVLHAIGQFEFQQNTALGPGLLAALRMIEPRAVIDPKFDTYDRAEHAIAQPPLFSRDPPPRYRMKHDPNRAPTDPSTLIVLVSDGRGTLGLPAVMAAEVVARHGVRVYTVGVGTLYGGAARVPGFDPVHADFQAEILELVARITGAQYTEAATFEDVKAIYRDLSQGKVRARTEVEVTFLFVACAALLIGTGAALSLRGHRPLP